MAFKLKHFLAGAAKEATNINEERRKQAMEMVQASMEMQGKRILDTQKAYKEQGKELEVAAAGLRRLNLNDAQIARVLNEGVDFANDFVEKAPIAAKARGVTPDTFVTIADPDAPLIPVSEYINRGDIAGRVEVGSFRRVEGLPKSIFGGTFDVGQDQRMEQYASTLGVEEQPAQERISAPKGTIDIMGMLPGKEPDNFLSNSTVFQNVANELATNIGMKGGMDKKTGQYIWSSEVPEREAKYNSAVFTLNILAQQELTRNPAASNTDIMRSAFSRLRQEYPDLVTFKNPNPADLAGGAVTGGDDLQEALAKGSPAQVAAVLSRDPENAGKNVQAMAEKLLDQYKGSAAAGAR